MMSEFQNRKLQEEFDHNFIGDDKGDSWKQDPSFQADPKWSGGVQPWSRGDARCAIPLTDREYEARKALKAAEAAVRHILLQDL